MREYKIDTEELNVAADDAEKLIDNMKGDINLLRNKESDIFKKFMAYNRIIAILDGIGFVLNIHKKYLISGRKLENKIFHTETAREGGWDKDRAHLHPFFIQDDEEKIINPAKGLIDLLRELTDK